MTQEKTEGLEAAGPQVRCDGLLSAADVCEWTLEKNTDFWQTSCGEEWNMPDNEGTPEENGINFCPMCGRKVVGT
jgi:hypothetical protein